MVAASFRPCGLAFTMTGFDRMNRIDRIKIERVSNPVALFILSKVFRLSPPNFAGARSRLGQQHPNRARFATDSNAERLIVTSWRALRS